MSIDNSVIREAEEQVTVRQNAGSNSSKETLACLNYLHWKCNFTINLRRNRGYKRVDRYGLFVDVFDERCNIVFRFLGCYWHPSQKRANPTHTNEGLSFTNIYQNALQKEEYVKSLGYEVVSIWECEWSMLCWEDAHVYIKKAFRVRGETLIEEVINKRMLRANCLDLSSVPQSFPAS